MTDRNRGSISLKHILKKAPSHHLRHDFRIFFLYKKETFYTFTALPSFSISIEVRWEYSPQSSCCLSMTSFRTSLPSLALRSQKLSTCTRVRQTILDFKSKIYFFLSIRSVIFAHSIQMWPLLLFFALMKHSLLVSNSPKHWLLKLMVQLWKLNALSLLLDFGLEFWIKQKYILLSHYRCDSVNLIFSEARMRHNLTTEWCLGW